VSGEGGGGRAVQVLKLGVKLPDLQKGKVKLETRPSD
jgi:hypothetical protein